ncbi:MAG: hypothetical protein ACYSX0_20855 [Planctomycetota bacterium]|jgi:uncharacterized membrane protein
MSMVFRLAHVLRKGPRRQRVQAWTGLVLVVSAVGIVVVVWLWRLLIVLALFLVGVYLLRRSVGPSSSRSSSS